MHANPKTPEEGGLVPPLVIRTIGELWNTPKWTKSGGFEKKRRCVDAGLFARFRALG